MGAGAGVVSGILGAATDGADADTMAALASETGLGQKTRLAKSASPPITKQPKSPATIKTGVRDGLRPP